MPSKIILKKSSVAAKTPLVGDLDYGELALNYTDGKLYYKTASNTISYFTTGAAQGTVTSVAGTGTVSGLTLTGTVTSSGSLTLGGTLSVTPANFASQTANTVLAAPNGSAGTPTFRTLVEADIPYISLEKVPDAWVKRSVKVATTANITLSGTQTVDGVALVAGDRVLVKDQTTASQNGIYVVSASAWARALDADSVSELAGACVNVDSGTTNGGFRFDTDFKTTDTLNTTSVTFYRVVDSFDLSTANTANKVVQRDASGNFSAGTITAALSGNASTATTLQTGRTIALTGDVTYTSGSFNGSANVTGTATLTNSGVTAGTYTKVTVDAKGRVTTGAALASADLPTYTGTISSSQITTGLGFTPYNATNPSGYITSSASISGNAATATTLQTARTINGVSFNGSANIKTSEWFHSDRDFASGTLVTTDINYAVTNGDPFVLEIRGNSYGDAVPYDIQYQGYIYSDTIINHGGYSSGTNIAGLVAINVGGNLCFWWPRQSYWNGFNVRVYTAYATVAVNRVTSITSTAKPTSTKEVALSANIRQSLHSSNYTSYSPTLTGTGASGTWGISVTGSAGSVAWANVTGRPTVVSSFTNDSGYITGSGVLVDKGLLATTGDWNTYTTAGVYQIAGASIGTNGPSGAYAYGQLIVSTNGNLVTQSYTAHTNAVQIWTRIKYNTSDWQPWVLSINSGNYNSYAPTLTGGGASGSWGISVTGSAGSVAWSGVTGRPTTLSAFTNDSGFITGSGSITGTAGSLTIDNTITWGSSGLQFVQVSGLGGTNPALTQAPDGNWWHIIRANHGNTGGYYTDLALPFTSDGGVQYRRISNGINNGWYLLLDSHNYNSYSPSLTGTGASGTWGISVTGSAGSVAWTNVSGRPTAVSSFTNDSGYITSSGTAARLTNFTSTTTVSAGTDNTESCTSYIGGISLFGQTDGALYSHVYSSAWKHNIFGDYRTGQLAVRGKNNGTWQAWRTVLDSSNFNSYALPLGGGTLIGTATGATSGSTTTSAFYAATTGGSYASMYGRYAPYRTSVVHTGSSYAPALSVYYEYTGSYSGHYSIGHLTTSGANPGNFVIHHINSAGAVSNTWSFDGANGNFVAGGNVTAYSDERLKKDWISLPTNFVEQLAKVKSGTYTRTDTQERQAGSSAQDWQQLLPEVVTVGADDDKTLGLAYGNAALVSAIELAKRVVAQDKKIAHLEALVAQLINKG